MEIQQIRYFLALADVLNFTAAAAACNVSQPALSRAISQLEAELGGALFRRERKLTHMTDFGRAVLPSLKECYESTLAAKELARNFHKKGHAPLCLALSQSLEISLLSPILTELGRAFPNIEIRVVRGSTGEVAERMRIGEAEVAISEPLSDDWDRIDARKLFEQQFGLLMLRSHRLARQNKIETSDLAGERLLSRPDCAFFQGLQTRLKQLGATAARKHEVSQIDDVPSLVEANLGLGIWPVDRIFRTDLLVAHIDDFPMRSTIQVYSVFGRGQSVAARTMIGLLRSADWSAANADASPKLGFVA